MRDTETKIRYKWNVMFDLNKIFNQCNACEHDPANFSIRISNILWIWIGDEDILTDIDGYLFFPELPIIKLNIEWSSEQWAIHKSIVLIDEINIFA